MKCERQGLVYFGGPVSGGGRAKLFWYCVDPASLPQLDGDAQRNKKKQRRHMELHEESCRVALEPVVEMIESYYGYCSVTAEHIYWFGENRKSRSMDLFKHEFNDTNPLSWDILSSNNHSFSPGPPFVVIPVAGKIYVLTGTVTHGCDCAPGEVLNMGAVYDLDSGTWEDVSCDLSPPIVPYHPPHIVFDEKNNEILFYSVSQGSILFFNLTTGQWRQDENHGSLDVGNSRRRHVGLVDCNFITLNRAIGIRAILRDNTLYWFTSDLLLYGYDINHRRWVQSPFLGEQFPTLKAFNPINGSLDNGLFPVLVDLYNNNNNNNPGGRKIYGADF